MSELYDNMSERKYTEQPLLEQLARQGWTVIDLDNNSRNDPTKSLRTDLSEVLLINEFKKALLRLNPWLQEEQLEELEKEFQNYGIKTDILNVNQIILQRLIKGLVADNLNTGDANQPVRVIDYSNLERDKFDIAKSKNSYIAICQFKVKIPGVEQHIIPDIVLFINGIPVVVIECKAPSIIDPVSEAIEQLLRYQDRRNASFCEGVKELFYYNQFLIATSFQQAVYSTITGNNNHFIEWKDPYPYALSEVRGDGGLPSSQEILAKGMLSPNNLLDIIQNFTVFKEDEKGRKFKVVCRYQQFRGVQKILNRMRTGDTQEKKGGTVWHTQGSGKSLTMMFTIKKMYNSSDFIDYKIVLILDRKDLQKQLFDTSNCIEHAVIIGKNMQDLRAKIKDTASNILVAMIHKFGDPKKKLSKADIFPTLNTSSKILIMIDEAHRTEYSALATNMWNSMPNSIKVAFTGTPIDRTTATFGEYIDTYTMKQAIKDEVIVEIKYEGRATDSEITDIAAMDDKFVDVFGFASEELKKLILGKYTLRGYLEAEEVISKKAKDMFEHYLSHIFPNGFKAQVVAHTQEAACRYKKAFDKLLSEKIEELTSSNPNNYDLNVLKKMEIACIISSQGNASPHLKVYGNESVQDRQINSFKVGFYDEDTDSKGNKVTGEVGIIIVQSMLLTGFDAPIEQVMYLDHVIRDHNLLQAIARVNRTAKNKRCGYVIDYVGVFNHLKKALSKYNEEDIDETLAVLQDISQDYDRLRIAHGNLIKFIKEEIKVEGINEKTVICNVLTEDDKLWLNYNIFYRAYEKYLDRVYPRPAALQYVPDFKIASFIKQSVANRRREGKMSVSECGRKVRAIIEEYLIVNGVNPKIKPVSLTSIEFEEGLKKKTSRECADELRYAIQEYININTPYDPEYFERLGIKLQRILEMYKGNWEMLAEELKNFRDTDIKNGRFAEDTFGYNPKNEMPFFALIKSRLYGDIAFEEMFDQDFDKLKSMTDDILSKIQSQTVLVNFWRDSDMKMQLRSEIRRIILDNYAELRRDRSKATALAQEVLELASQHYGGRS